MPIGILRICPVPTGISHRVTDLPFQQGLKKIQIYHVTDKTISNDQWQTGILWTDHWAC